MRPMLLEFPKDHTSWYLDQQYMFGSNLLVAPVFGESDLDYYVPEGTWTNILNGSEDTGPAWVSGSHSMLTLPVLLRPNSALVIGKAGHSVMDSIADRGFVVVITRQIVETLVMTVALRHNEKIQLTIEATTSGAKISCDKLEIAFDVVVIGSGKGLDGDLSPAQASAGTCEVQW